MRRSYWFRLASFAGALSLLYASADIARAGERVALVIGNGAYRSIATLANPPNDAEDVAAELRILGFNVTTGSILIKRAWSVQSSDSPARQHRLTFRFSIMAAMGCRSLAIIS